MFAGLLFELLIKLRFEQPAYLVKSSLLNTSILENEASNYPMSRILVRIANYAESMNYRALYANVLDPHSSPTAMRRRLCFYPHPIQERGELKFIAPDDGISIPPSADGLEDTWIILITISLVYRYAWMYICVDLERLVPFWL